MEDLMKIDLYELLNISISAEEKDIKKAYRKKALTCHPDKNPDNPQAAQLFQQLSKALEILTDTSARAAYNKVLNARKAAQIRRREFDGKRKKLKEDLEAREKLAKEQDDKISSEEKLRKEIERLRKEGSKQLEEEQELLRQQFAKEALSKNTAKTAEPSRLKVKWKSNKNDKTNGGYNQEILEKIFKKYGQVTCLVSSRKSGSAIIEFSTPEAGMYAFEVEKGNADNPLALSWISGKPSPQKCSDSSTAQTIFPNAGDPSTLTNRDYESVVLMKLRQAEERKKLIQQMMDEDE